MVLVLLERSWELLGTLWGFVGAVGAHLGVILGAPRGDLGLLGKQSFNGKGRQQQQRSKNNKANTENIKNTKDEYSLT